MRVRSSAGKTPMAISVAKASRRLLRRFITHGYSLEESTNAYGTAYRVDGALTRTVRPDASAGQQSAGVFSQRHGVPGVNDDGPL